MRIAVVIAIAVMGGMPSPAQPGGQRLYQANCARCHGLDAHGGEHAPNIATVQRVRQLPDADLLRTIRDGLPGAGMPAFGERLNSEELSAIAGYLRTLQGEQKTISLPGNPETGERLFFSKAACAECHMIAGKGGFIAADLSAFAATRSIEQIREAILDPNENLDLRHAIALVVTKDSHKYIGVVRNEDNSSMQLQTRDGVFHLFNKSTLASLTRQEKSWMPDDYGSRFSPTDVNDLISYLIETAAREPKPVPGASEW
jgi:cytochrome c oxidase cbb3-type subunit III